MNILGYILVTVIAIAISPVLKGLVNKFVEEDEIEERESAKNDTSKKDKSKKEDKKIKVKFVPDFDWKVTATTVLLEVILFMSFGITAEFFVYGFLTLLLVICMFADIKGCIIPNEVNFVGFIAGVILAFVKMSFNVNAGLDSLAGMLVGFLIFLAIAGLSLLVFKREGMGGRRY